ncbi:hypothetical protein CVV68_19160 [Arthrobacter livingstonensis]|uniref:Uncharacterized protein n=1 Tax=Arthrobacter livingstonensis TaxID=670078 RepID=A0A2V5LFT5_9MICC|nr:hypothetical protein [Arthrobacter livingstonensis]PYI65230.1 hypothetical protein CVV68_19160 [Arthrobacter livingstonensis]
MTSPSHTPPDDQPQPSRTRDHEDPSWGYGNPFTGKPAGVAHDPGSRQAEFDAAPLPGTNSFH